MYCSGSDRSCPIGLRRFNSRISDRLRLIWFARCLKARSSVRCFSCCTRPNCSASLKVKVWKRTRTRSIPKSTSACLPRRHCLLLIVSWNVWSLSNCGWEAIVCDWTWTNLCWSGLVQGSSYRKSSSKKLCCSATVPFSSAVTNLGVTIDSELRMADHIANFCKSSYFQLRQLRQIRRSLTTDARKTLVHAFISSRLDYCNSLLFGIGEGLVKKLQSVQNAAARFIMGIKKHDHITRCFETCTGCRYRNE